MTDLIYTVWYALSAFGLWYIVGYSQISLPLRRWWKRQTRAGFLLDLVQCPACSGFWIGLAAGAYHFRNVAFAFVTACFTCASNLLLARLAGVDSHDD